MNSTPIQTIYSMSYEVNTIGNDIFPPPLTVLIPETHVFFDEGQEYFEENYSILPTSDKSNSSEYYNILKPRKHIANLIIEDAIKNGNLCPITMEPISPHSVCVAPCYHVFKKDAIETWLQTATTCPECRVQCVL